MELSNSHAVVTGASRGIGEALTKELCARGCRVTMVARSRKPLEIIAADTGAAIIETDLSRNSMLEDLIFQAEQLNGPVDILINNAALGEIGPFIDKPLSFSRRHINANLIAPMELTRQALPGMIERGRGVIIMVSSVAGEMATRNAAPYGASKAGLSLFASNLQRELKKNPVSMLLTILGEVETSILDEVRKDPLMSEVAKKIGKLKAMTPQGVAKKIAEAIVKDKEILVLPPAARPIFTIRNIPSRIMDFALRGID